MEGLILRKIILVEDDPNIAKSIVFNLEQEDLRCKWTENIQDAKAEIGNEKFDLYLLDINLPDGTGIELCRDLRSQNINEPVIFITANQSEDVLLDGFDAGANDFVKKPFSNKELIARIKANLKHLPMASEKLTFNGLELDMSTRLCTYKEMTLKLNRRLFDILYYFLSNRDRVITRENLLSYLGNEEVFDRTIDAHISQLRKKLKTNMIEDVQITSIYGVGYKIDS